MLLVLELKDGHIADWINCVSCPSLEMAPLVLSICQMSLGDVTFSQDSSLASDIVTEKVYLTAERTLRIGWNIMSTSESQLLFI